MRPSRPDPDFPFLPKNRSCVWHCYRKPPDSEYRKDTFREENAHYVSYHSFFSFLHLKKKMFKRGGHLPSFLASKAAVVV